MAGTIQTLILNPSSSVTPSFRHGHPHFRSIRTSTPFLISLPFNHGRPIPIRASQLPNHSNGSEPSRSSKLVWSKPLLNFASQNFLPLALIGGVALGLVNPSLGCLADKYYLSKFSSFSIFIISGLTLRNGEIGDAVHAWKIGLLGLCSILLFTPYFSRIILQLQLQPQEFVTGLASGLIFVSSVVVRIPRVTGLAIFCCMPTTLSSGVALTQLAGGNSALALAMTVISNLLGILIVPFSISRFIAAGVGVTIPTKQLFKSLVLTLLVPLILGKVFRESFKGLRDFVDQNRKLFSNMSAVLLSLVPFIQVSRSRSLLLMVKPTVFVVAVAMGVLLHLILLGFNFLALGGLSAASGGNQSLSSEKENAVAYLLVASQKTLPVMVAVVEQLGGAFGESGLLVLPCVAAHINQIIIDSFLVNFWFRKDLVSTDAKVA